MTVFNTFLKVIKKNIVTIIIYTVIVIVFAAANMQTDNSVTGFISEKPAVMVVNNDTESASSKNFEKYLDENTNIVKIEGTEDDIADALFYRDITCIVTIPKNFGECVKKGIAPEVEIKTSGNEYAAFSEMIISQYLRIQNACAKRITDENTLIESINKSLDKKAEVEFITKLNTGALGKAKTYFNFAAYSMMSCILFIVCLVLSSFNEISVRKRTIVSSMDYKKYSFDLFLSGFSYSFVVWLFFMLLSIVMVGESMFSLRGLIFIMNAFVFTLSSLALAYMLSCFLLKKNAITGIVNVLTLGFSFLCGVFVPEEYLPSWVLGIAHIMPTYWYVQNNGIISTNEHLSGCINELLINILVVIGFTIVFAVTGVIVSINKRKIA